MELIFYGSHSSDWMDKLNHKNLYGFLKNISKILNIYKILDLKKYLRQNNNVLIIPLMEKHYYELYIHNIKAIMPSLENINLLSCKYTFHNFIIKNELLNYVPETFLTYSNLFNYFVNLQNNNNENKIEEIKENDENEKNKNNKNENNINNVINENDENYKNKISNNFDNFKNDEIDMIIKPKNSNNGFGMYIKKINIESIYEFNKNNLFVKNIIQEYINSDKEYVSHVISYLGKIKYIKTIFSDYYNYSIL